MILALKSNDHMKHVSKPSPVIQQHSFSIHGDKMPCDILESINRLANIADNVCLKNYI
jgi:hypothetical protein